MSTAWVECWKCDECGWRWIKTETWPERCASSKCRKRSWNKNAVVAQAVRAPEILIPKGRLETPEVGGSSPPAAIDMQALRDICAGKLDPEDSLGAMGISGHGSGLADPCPKTGYNETDGETYRCLLAKGHKPPCRPGERV